ncbi:MAG TPA: hypothetical protein V6D28_02800 [Leptolyngbyaceae cyanobacterium]
MDIKKVTNVPGVKGVAEQIQEQAAGIASAAQEQFNAVLEEYQKVIPIAESLGLKIGSFNIDMGVLPEIKTSLIGSVDLIQKEAVKSMITTHQSNKILVTILNALLITKDLQEKWHITNMKDIVVNIKLGVPPAISVHLAS